MHHVTAQGVDERMINVHLLLLLLCGSESFVPGTMTHSLCTHLVVDVDRCYTALFSALGQTHCACM